MITDSITNASATSAPRDSGKKKRVTLSSLINLIPFSEIDSKFWFLMVLLLHYVLQNNKSAKMKQNKLGLRREQWLSQG